MTNTVVSQFRAMRHARTAAAVGSLVGAVAASSCCMLPLVLFMLGVSGAWIGSLVRLAPYQPYFIGRPSHASAAGIGLCIAGRSRDARKTEVVAAQRRRGW